MDLSTDMEVIIGDGVGSNQTNTGRGVMSSSSGEKHAQITITLTADGAAKVTDVCGTEYMVDRETLINSKIDPNDMDQQAVDTLLNMTIYGQPNRFADLSFESAAISTTQMAADRRLSKVANKRMRREATSAHHTQRKRRCEEQPENERLSSSALGGPQVNFPTPSFLMRFAGATCYKPVKVKQNKTGPNFCCAVCNKAMSKAGDFILLRLPAHSRCAKNTMMVVSDDDGDVHCVE